MKIIESYFAITYPETKTDILICKIETEQKDFCKDVEYFYVKYDSERRTLNDIPTNMLDVNLVDIVRKEYHMKILQHNELKVG